MTETSNFAKTNTTSQADDSLSYSPYIQHGEEFSPKDNFSKPYPPKHGKGKHEVISSVILSESSDNHSPNRIANSVGEGITGVNFGISLHKGGGECSESLRTSLQSTILSADSVKCEDGCENPNQRMLKRDKKSSSSDKVRSTLFC